MSELPPGITAIDSPMAGLRIETAAARGTIFFQGAHITEWVPAGQEPVIWTSPHAEYAPGKAIRGGIPVIFPWFGAGINEDQHPNHGFARLSQWCLKHAEVSDQGTARLIMRLDGCQAEIPVKTDFPCDYALELHVSMGEALLVQLVVIAGEEPLTFEDGLHTYLAVDDIAKTSVEGMAATSYLDRNSGVEAATPRAISFVGETDHIVSTRQNAYILDGGKRTILIEKVGSAQTVIWNPWQAKAAQMSDFGDDEWRRMVCVEAVNVRAEAIHLEPRERHLISQTISLI